jgi:hypothetical protein
MVRLKAVPNNGVAARMEEVTFQSLGAVTASLRSQTSEGASVFLVGVPLRPRQPEESLIKMVARTPCEIHKCRLQTRTTIIPSQIQRCKMFGADKSSVVKLPTVTRNTARPPSHKFTTDNLVTLDVGPSHHKIIVHTHSITRNSEFSSAALGKKRIESQTRTIELPEEISEHMEYYCDYLYSGELPTKDFINRHDGDFMEPSFELLANLYVLGERRMDTKLRNVVVHEILRIQILPLITGLSFGATVPVPPTTAVNIIYQGTPEGSPARRLMIDMVIAHGKKA